MENNDRLGKLASFASALCRKRQEAVDGRKLSGVDDIWQEDDEYYDGIDEANRGSAMLKPSTMQGRLVERTNKSDPSKSTVFINITQPYVDMASARIADMCLPTDDMPFSLSPTPIPEISDSTENESEMMPGGQHTVGEASKAFLADMDKKAEKAETQIWDWLVEAKWHGEVRKVIEQAARIGCGCLKGPFPIKHKKRKMSNNDGIITLEIIEELKPFSKAIDVWNLYPDPNCGESIHNGSYIFEKDYLSAKQVKDLKGTGYIDSEIDSVLKEGPCKRNIEDRKKFESQEIETFEVWYYYGIATSEDLEASGCKCEEGSSMGSQTSLPVVVTMINDRIIKASISILDSGEFPYDVMVWQRRAGTWTGKSVSRQVRTPQKMINAASRNLLDNAGVSAGPQIILRRGVIYPADGQWSITPMKIWVVDQNADIQEVSHAITAIQIPSMQAELENIIKMALEFAERATSMPIMMQGQQGSATHTVGGMEILQKNSNTVQRRIAKIYDDDLVIPHISRFYEYLMIHGDDDSMKGDFNIVAMASSAFYERDAQNQMIMQMIPMSANPAFGLDPDLLMNEALKMNKISPDRVVLSDEKKQQLAQQKPQVVPQIEAAKIRVDGDMQKAQLIQQSDMSELQQKNETMEKEFALKLHLQEMEMDHQLKMKNMELQVKMMELAQSQQISLDSIKAALADKTMSLATMKELHYSDQSKATLNTPVPPFEPQGQAEPGHAYEQ